MATQMSHKNVENHGWTTAKWWTTSQQRTPFFFFFLRRYNFREVLAFSTNSFHLGRFLMQFFQFVTFIFVISLFTSSSHLFLGLPSDLVSAGDHSYAFFTVLLSGIRCTCPNQANLCALIQFIMFWLPISLFSLSFDLTHWHTQPAVRRSEPSMSFAFNSSLQSVDGMTCLIPFESWWNALLKINFAWIKYTCTKLPFSPKN